MAKIVDITEKLNFEDNPKIKIKEITCRVNTDAPTALKIMQLMGDGEGVSPNDVVNMYELIFNEADRKKIDKLKLQFKDFQTLVMSAITLITGDEEPGE